MMSELDTAHLQERLSEIYEQRLKDYPSQSSTTMDDDLGMETGYVTDSSINSRKGNAEISNNLTEQTTSATNKSRKTKSERDKRRSSRVSLLDTKVDSAGENSSESSTEEKQPRYRKRAGSKRVELDNTAGNNNNNADPRRRRAGSKNVSHNLGDSHSSLLPGASEDKEEEENNMSATEPINHTLKMNGKNIYYGTWNPTERAVLDQVLHNIDGKSDGKKSFMGKLRWGNNNKDKSKIKDKYEKIEEAVEEEHLNENSSEAKHQISHSESYQKKVKIGLFRKLKESVRQRHAVWEEAYIDRQLKNYGVSSSPSPNQKKKGLLSRLSSSTKRKEAGGGNGRSRAHSSNDYARSLGMFVPPENVVESKPTHHQHQEKEKSNLSKKKSGSFRNVFTSASRAKSVDNLHGAFQYYANQKQVFQRTPSMSKLNSRSASTEKLDKLQRSASQKSLEHAFEPVKYTTKELCYDDPVVFAQARFVQPHRANQRNVYFPARQQSSDGYCSAYEEDYYRGYQSDVSPGLPITGHQYRHFNFDIPYPYSDTERPVSSMSPGYYPTPPPRRAAPPMYYRPPPQRQQHPHQHQNQPILSPYFIPQQHAPPMPGYYTPGYATPGAMYPPSGYETPPGYASESDYGYARSPLFAPVAHQTGAHSAVASPAMHIQARKATQRSLSKNSSAASNYSGNYGYGSESSFCDDDVYSMVRPPMQTSQFYEQRTNSSQTSRTSQLSTDV